MTSSKKKKIKQGKIDIFLEYEKRKNAKKLF